MYSYIFITSEVIYIYSYGWMYSVSISIDICYYFNDSNKTYHKPIEIILKITN